MTRYVPPLPSAIVVCPECREVAEHLGVTTVHCAGQSTPHEPTQMVAYVRARQHTAGFMRAKPGLAAQDEERTPG